MANKRIDQLPINSDMLKGTDLVPLWDVVNNKTERVELSSLASFIDTSVFTGNTSGTCITNLHVSNLYGCLPITIHNNIQSVTSLATGTTSFVFGQNTKALRNYSHAEGYETIAGGSLS